MTPLAALLADALPGPPHETGAAELPPFREYRAQGLPAGYLSRGDYLRVLSRWPRYAESYWHEIEGDATMARDGGGDSHWGMMCHASAMFCYALHTTDPAYVPRNGGPGRAQVLARVNQGLRLMTRSHLTGGLKCTDGKPWRDPGGRWHSATWAENMGTDADHRSGGERCNESGSATKGEPAPGPGATLPWRQPGIPVPQRAHTITLY